MVSNCITELSFSKMKLLKNRLRNTMCSDRFSHLDLMSRVRFKVEDPVIEFSKMKAQIVSLLEHYTINVGEDFA